jgi:capsid assembly protease
MWLLPEQIARDLEAARRAFVPTAEQVAAFEAREAELLSTDMPRNLRIAGNEAEIIVEGLLTKRRELFYSYYGSGNCTYNDICSALALAEVDPNVKRVILKIDSPGGQAGGLLETIKAIEAFSKPIVARASLACSAAYSLAAACNRIEAVNEASEFGCLGVACTFFVWDDEITLTNTDSPEKRPDPRTAEGKASIVRWLDAINEWYTAAIARGRTAAGKAATVEQVAAEYGRGATLTAPDAKKRGMIDGYVTQRTPAKAAGARAESEPEPSASDNDSRHGGGEEIETMLKKLLAQALGLSEGASDEAFATSALAFAQQKKDADAAKATAEAKASTAETTAKEAEAKAKATEARLEAIETKVGAKGDALMGAIDGLLAAKTELDKATAKLAEQAEAAEKLERSALEKQGTADGKLTPALITHYAGKPLAELKGFLDVAPVVVPRAVTQPKAAGAGKSAGKEQPAQTLTHEGKTWAELTPSARAALKKSDPDAYNAMRSEALGGDNKAA